MRGRLKAAKPVETNGSTTLTTKRPSTATTPTFRRMSSSGTTPSFRAMAKAVAVSGNSTTATKDQGQNFEQMMARFQLRQLEFTGSGRNLETDRKMLHQRSTAYKVPVFSEMSQHRICSTHRRIEGEQIDTTIGREGDGDILTTSQSRTSRGESSSSWSAFFPFK
ncbi:hypothetical protein F442_08132, partial [Phytophthora nicotianae P10297]